MVLSLYNLLSWTKIKRLQNDLTLSQVKGALFPINWCFKGWNMLIVVINMHLRIIKFYSRDTGGLKKFNSLVIIDTVQQLKQYSLLTFCLGLFYKKLYRDNNNLTYCFLNKFCLKTWLVFLEPCFEIMILSSHLTSARPLLWMKTNKVIMRCNA